MVTTLFPENVPRSRDRYTGYAGLSFSLFPSTAIHVAQALYHDSWGVDAFIPEVAIAQQIGRRVTAFLRYRFYSQDAATFYRPLYSDLQPIMSGDFRLGRIRDHSAGASIEVLLVERAFATIACTLAYDLAQTQYTQISSDVTAHIGSLGVEGRY